VLAASNIGAITALMMVAASTSEMSVNFYQTTYHNNPQASHLQLINSLKMWQSSNIWE
jgi:hypothetical protein